MKSKLPAFALLLFCMACNSSNEKTQTSNEMEKKATITEKPFGNYEGKPVTEYTLTNVNGMQAGIINYGGAVTKLITPAADSSFGDVITGFESLEGYLQKDNPYFGALIGRYGNRIGKAKFTLDGKEYILAQNNNGNTLHGGNKGFDKAYWNIEKLPGDSSLKLTYLSKDGEEGYPGNLDATVIYTLSADNALKIEYTATTDKPTVINLTSHGYFNLSAGKDSTILNHQLRLNAKAYTPVDNGLIPTGEIKAVAATPMDFTKAKPVGRDMASVPGGYDHNWVLNKTGKGLELAAVLSDSVSGRIMEVWTTEPALQFYSGNFLNGALMHTKGGMRYVNHGALCLETQHYPDSPNKPGFPSTVLRPGETYRQTTIYKFSVKQK